MRKFDFNDPLFKELGGPERQHFYKDQHDKPWTEDEFVAEVAKWPKKPKNNSATRCASKARRDYRYLVRTYGFFPGGQA